MAKKARFYTKKWLKLDKKPLILLAIFIFEFSFPQISAAEAFTINTTNLVSGAKYSIENSGPRNTHIDKIFYQQKRQFLPQGSRLQPRRVIYVIVTAYSSTSDQTDDTPCITANGLDVCKHNKEDIVAVNFLPFGSKVKFPDYFGKDKFFYVNDRMNMRYAHRVDIWMKSRRAAKRFGIRRLKMEIY